MSFMPLPPACPQAFDAKRIRYSVSTKYAMQEIERGAAKENRSERDGDVVRLERGSALLLLRRVAVAVEMERCRLWRTREGKQQDGDRGGQGWGRRTGLERSVKKEAGWQLSNHSLSTGQFIVACCFKTSLSACILCTAVNKPVTISACMQPLVLNSTNLHYCRKASHRQNAQQLANVRKYSCGLVATCAL